MDEYLDNLNLIITCSEYFKNKFEEPKLVSDCIKTIFSIKYGNFVSRFRFFNILHPYYYGTILECFYFSSIKEVYLLNDNFRTEYVAFDYNFLSFKFTFLELKSFNQKMQNQLKIFNILKYNNMYDEVIYYLNKTLVDII